MNLKHQKIKFRLLFIPYTAMSFGLVAFLVLVRWLFITKLSHLQILDDFYSFFIPLALALSMPYLLFRKPLSAFRIRRAKAGPTDFILANSLFLLMGLVFLPRALDPYIFPTKQVDNILDTTTLAANQYFHINNYHLDSSHKIVHYTSQVSKSGRSRNMTLYGNACLPFQRSEAKVWLGLEVSEPVESPYSIENQQKAQKKVQQALEQKIREQLKLGAKSFEKQPYSASWLRFNAAIEKHDLYRRRITPIILTPRTNLTTGNTSITEPFIIGGVSMGVSLLFALLLTLISKFDIEKYENRKAQPFCYDKEFLIALQLLNPFSPYKASALLINLNLLLFIPLAFVMLKTGGISDSTLLAWGALSSENLEQGEIWRLLSYGFLHESPFHLIMNLGLLSLAFFILSQHLKAAKTILLYCVCTVTGAAAFLIGGETNVLATAAPALMGFAGLILVYLQLGVFGTFAKRIYRLAALAFIAIYIGVQAIMEDHGFWPSVGGLLAGIFFALITAQSIAIPKHDDE